MQSLGKVLALLGAGTLASVTVIVMSVTEQMTANPRTSANKCELVARAEENRADFAVLRGPVVQSYLKAGEAWDQEQCNQSKSRCSSFLGTAKNKRKAEAQQKIS